MERLLKQFLEEDLNLPYQVLENFEGSKIIKADYNPFNNPKDNYILVVIELDQVLPFNSFLEVEKALEQHPYNFKVLYESNKAIYNENLVLEYYKYFVEKLVNNGTVFSDILTYDFANDNDLKIKFVNDSFLDMYLKSKNKVEHAMQLAGFKLNYEYLIESDEQFDNKVENLTKNETIKLPSKKEEYQNNNNNNYNNQNNGSVQKQKQSFYRKSLTDLSKYEVVSINTLYDQANDICIEGYIFDDEIIETRTKKHIQTFKITDYSDSIMMKRFEGRGLTLDDMKEIKKGMWVRAVGQVKYDEFAKEFVLFLEAIQPIESKTTYRKDEEVEKRVELHLHTNMSVMDGISTVNDYVKLAKEFGHQAIAITDHNNIQAFPDAQHATSGEDIKMIYGLEASIVEEDTLIVMNATNQDLDAKTYVFFDFETTGLSSVHDKIIEFGAVKYEHGIETGNFQSFVNPHRKLTNLIVELTNIHDHDLVDAPDIEEVLPKFLEFVGDSVLVAHNASFDISFLKQAMQDLNYPTLNNIVIDTLLLSRALNPDKRAHNLGAASKFYNVAYDSDVAHRADYDAEVLGRLYEGMKNDLKTKRDIHTFEQINSLVDKNFLIKQRPYHLSILAKNQSGLKDLFKLVTLSHVDYFSDEAKMYKSHIQELRKDLLIGSGCVNGEVYQYARSLDDQSLQEVMRFYDYIEVFPIENLEYLVTQGQYGSKEELIAVTKSIIKNALAIDKLVVATGDVHYAQPNMKEYREVYVSAPRTGGALHPMYNRKNPLKELPDQHYRTTKEMLDCFSFLEDEKLIKDIVVTNTNKIADMIEEVKPIKDKLYTPKIEGVDEKLTNMCYENAYKQYGKPLPQIVEARLEKELNSIIKHGFSVVYYISSELVEKSLSDGYLVGSRGSVGSSFVATMANITEVNPLVAHYYCPHCTYSEFFEDGSVASGYDLVDKDCPKCGKPMKGDGQDIPFETFLGFEGDKVPDIDLNFSGEYQPVAHNFTKEMFGEEYVYRAGTIGTVQEKTAFGFVNGYFEKLGNKDSVRKAEKERLAQGCAGVKRSTGQHPGGIIVIPDYMDVHDFTPVNYPADDLNSSWKTTHFDFHAIHDNVLKLDILGHVDPTAIRMLQDLTGVDPKSIPTNDQKVLSLFSSNEAIGIQKLVSYKNAAIGIPEFGTSFVRGMLEETNPTSFAELVQISGLSHGTDVWLNNAQSLIKRGICTLSEVIGCRDDIMVYLMYKNLEPKLAFTIMESVRKGKGLKEEWIETMKANDVPEWYIDSCLKIKYMFPKAHAVAYVLMALRVAWFKVYYPLEYYATYFSTRCDHFEIEYMVKGQSAIEKRLDELNNLGFEATAKEDALVVVYEVLLEMTLRGYSFKAIDLQKSKATSFVVDNETKSLYPPFTSVDGLGTNVAYRIEEEAKKQPFISKQDLIERTRINNNQVLYLERIGTLDHLQELNQMSLF